VRKKAIRFSMDDCGDDKVPIGNITSALIRRRSSIQHFDDGDVLARGKPEACSDAFGSVDYSAIDVHDQQVIPRAFILLSTYNGAAYLQVLLQSLMTQTHEPWILYWRDDGSSDATVSIMLQFAAVVGGDRCIRVMEPTARLWPAASFQAILNAALPALGPADGVAFADQDDVWRPEKLARGLAALAAADPRQPALYCARLVIVNANLKRLAETSISQRKCGFPASLTQNIASGCTIMLNRCAAALVAGSVPPSSSPHDWWSYLLVSAAGGRIVVDDSRVALYRQHRSNHIGIQASQVRRAFAAMRRGRRMFMNVLRQHVEALNAQSGLVCEAARPALLQLHDAMHGSFRQRLSALRLPGLRRQSALGTLLFRICFLIG
jgi:Glycosyl transferase family 2